MTANRPKGKRRAVRVALGLPDGGHVALATTVHGEYGAEVCVLLDVDDTTSGRVLADLHSDSVTFDGPTYDGGGVTFCGEPAALEALGEALVEAARAARRVRRVAVTLAPPGDRQ